MIVIEELLRELKGCGVRLRLDGDQLVVRAPKGSLSSSLRRQLGLAKPKLIEFLRSGGYSFGSEASFIRPQRRSQQSLPMSFAQQRLWFFEQLEGPGAVYNIPLAMLVCGDLNEDIVSRVVHEIVHRHETLRTSFVVEEGQPRQRIHTMAVLSNLVSIEELTVLERETPEQAMQRVANEEATRPFDLGQPPLLRVRILRICGGQRLLLLTVHHIAADGWSMGILLHEFVTLYQAFSQGHASPLAPLPVQYSDFALWQRAEAQQRVFAEQLRYWREQLSGAPELLNLPTDRPRGAARGFDGGLHSFTVEEGLTRQLRSLSRSSGSTLFITLIAAFALLLQRYSGQDDLVIGTPIANRNRSEIEGLIGFFVNMLCLRLQPEQDCDFHRFMEQVRKVAFEGYGHQDLPFEQLVDALNPKRDLSYTPLFQSVFVLQHGADSGESLEGLEFKTLTPESVAAKFDLILVMEEAGSLLHGRFQYNALLFTPNTINRICDHFLQLLGQVTRYPNNPLADLTFLTEAEARQTKAQLHTGRSDYTLKLVERIAAHARIRPQRPAVRYRGQSLSYGELEQRAFRLAIRLQQEGVGPGGIVALILPRSPALVIGQLAILKTGAAFLPLDPSHPDQRLTAILDNAGVQHVISNRSHNLPASIQRMALNQEEDEGTELVFQQPPPAAVDDPVYVIYTSGSTGTPKGVVVPHRGLNNLINWHIETFGIEPESELSQLAAPAFDASIWEIWPCLAAGAGLSIFEDTEIEDLAGLVQRLTGRGITHAFMPTPLAEQAVQLPWPENCCLQFLFTGGDRLHHYPPAGLPFQLVNNYGPSEYSVVATSIVLQPGTGERGVPPIGRPIANTGVCILDRRMRLLPMGMAGELCLTGEGLALGYHRRPDLTAERFIANPFGPGMLYRTGDRARLREDGNLEFLGRIDQQIQLRGFRIEPAEIEIVLGQHPQVCQALVKTYRTPAGTRQLCGYYIPADDEISPDILYQYLRVHLPEYMIPAGLMPLTDIPLTRHNKIDYRNLPLPESPRQDDAIKAGQPVTATEQILARCWAEVLGLDKVGIHDNYFQLGGDSIRSIQIVARAAQEGLTVTTRQFFQHQTIHELARCVTESDRQQPLVERTQVLDKTVLTPIQHWFFNRQSPAEHHFNHSFLFKVVESLQPELVEQALTCLMEHHDVLRHHFVKTEMGWQASESDSAAVLPFSIYDLSLYSAEEKPAKLDEICNGLQAGFDLERGPLIQVAYFDYGASHQGRLLFVIHHLLVDAVSWKILFVDFQHLYEELAAGRQPQLPAKSSSYLEWAGRLQHSAGRIEQAERQFWLDILAGGSEPLPRDFIVGPDKNTISSEEHLQHIIDPNLSHQLLGDMGWCFTMRPHEILLVALGLALQKWSTCRRLLIDIESHGRVDLFEDIDLSRTVGWFTSLAPFPVELTGQGLLQDLKKIKNLLRSIPRQGIGFGLLRFLSPDKKLQNQLEELDTAEVSFNYFGQQDKGKGTFPLMEVADESPGHPLALERRRGHVLIISGMLVDRQLVMDFSYSRNLHARENIIELAGIFEEVLQDLATLSQLPETDIAVPADFPLAGLDQEQLDHLLGQTVKGGQSCEALYPLSPMQEGMLFHSLQELEGRPYFEQFELQLEGSLDTQQLEWAWDQLVAENGVLRSRFFWRELAKPLQLVLQGGKPSWQTIDWRHLHQSKQGARLQLLKQEDRVRGFVLEKEVPLRCQLILLGETQATLLISCHHILFDGWSLPLLLKRLLNHYQVFDSSLKAPRPYADYIAWLKQRDDAASVEFWREELEGFSAPTPLPQGEAIMEGTEVKLSLGREVSRRLQDLARQERVTLNTIFQAAWGLLLGTYSGEDRVLFGTTLSGRSPELDGVEDMIGLFINTVPVRVEWHPSQELGSWLRHLHKRQHQREESCYMALTDLQSLCNISRPEPLFASLLIFENYPTLSATGEKTAGLQFTGLRGEERTHYPLTLIVGGGDQLVMHLSTIPGYYCSGDLDRFINHLRFLLLEFSRCQGKPLVAQNLISPEEEAQLADWNALSHPAESADTALRIEELFAAAVRHSPEAPALECDGQVLSYAQLDRAAEQIARQLQGAGAGAEARVGVYCDRSPELIIALLAILKSGSCYVPLDPSYPRERLAFMLQDAEVSIVVSRRQFRDSLSGLLDGEERTILWLDDQQEHEPMAPLSQAGSSSDLAYILYTSGSTGLPKGVAIEHRSVVALLDWAGRVYSEDELCRVMASTSVCFDLSVFEIFLPLSRGGCVVLVENGLSLKDNKVSVSLINTVPSVMTELVRHRAIPETVRTVNLAGEPLKGALVREIFAVSEVEAVYNLYGPSEDTTYSTWVRLERGFSGEPTIGVPISQTTASVLDSRLRPVPIGAAGELCLGGAGLARGYINRPEQTAESFIANPNGAGRLYRTGDLVRFASDGQLIFLGRLDHQVKLRGYRIELGEIEAALVGHRAVSQCLVTTRQLGDEVQLIAYVESGLEPPSSSDLRTYLGRTLPGYMIPARFVLLEQLPLTPNGKIDRNRLPEPGSEPQLDQDQVVEPRDRVELALSHIWRELLEQDRVSVISDFFAAGGHSLLALRCLSRMEQTFGRNISLSEFMRYSTIEAMALFLKRGEHQLSSAFLVPLQSCGKRLPIYMVHPGGGTVLCYQGLARQLGSNQPCYGLQARGLEEGELPAPTVDAMAEEYLAAIRRHQPRGPYRLLGWSFGGHVAHAVACRLHKEKEHVCLVLIDCLIAEADGIEPEPNNLDLLKEIVGAGLDIDWQRLADLPAEKQIENLLEEAREARLVPPDLDTGRVHRLLKLIRNNGRIVSHHKHQRFGGPVLLFVSREAAALRPSDATLGWQQFAAQQVTVHDLGGDHYSILQQPRVAELAPVLAEFLEGHPDKPV
ncbi:non-ribosomal peptide synthetase [Desulfopila sp. IMCC35008]|uniref:non-ribosomal peptide synthetase n=1 Tax=Desulfopila sp. IMCC35008 TaxID=2653858 RepID=UPI0027153D41|nr:non-ribosomal peptide synthetase [Desulfopila sp. IMCC35008]